MIRSIVKSNKNQLMLQLPDDMVGKTIEVIAFEIDQVSYTEPPTELKMQENAEAINMALSKYRIDLSNFKFDRDDANDY